MNKTTLTNQLVDALKKENILAKTNKIGIYTSLAIATDDWYKAGAIAKKLNARFVSIFAKELALKWQITAIFYLDKNYLILRVNLEKQSPTLDSLTENFLAASRMERHISDLYGIVFTKSIDQRRWTRHKAWEQTKFPLQKKFQDLNLNKQKTPADSDYPFLALHSEDTYEIPVGPVHAGIIEPGHFRFQAAGENIIYMEERLGYVHKGIEKLAVNKTCNEVLKIAARVSGDSAVGHSLACVSAMENALAISIPKRAIALRVLLLERERIINHLWDIAALCNDVAFAFAYFQFGRIREIWLRTNQAIYEHRLLMDTLILGGVKHDLTLDQGKLLLLEIKNLKKELEELAEINLKNSSLKNRFLTTGILTKDVATELGVTGFIGRASGLEFDVRKDAPGILYENYCPKVPSQQNGDVAARYQMRIDEIYSSLEILEKVLLDMPQGPIANNNIESETNKEREGLGIIEGWRGEIVTYIALDKDLKVTRFFPRDPSWFQWLALEKLLYNDIVPDFPVCNKSINGSYSGSDL